MTTPDMPRKNSLSWAVTCALISWQGLAVAQDVVIAAPKIDESAWVADQPAEEAMEEVVVTGRFISASQQVINERLSDSSVTDLLDAETMQRLGDSTVADALRRVPGISLVADKYIYIRGLGERYSCSYLKCVVLG